jgi:hypothetical protein
MTKVFNISPVISDLLDEFFAGYSPNATKLVHARVEAIRADLWRHLDREGPRVLDAGQLAVLETEKQFDAEGAFARTMRAADLYYCLDHYLEPAHAMLGLEQRQVQIDVIAALTERVRRVPGIENKVSECCAIELDLALARAREQLGAAKELEKVIRGRSQ